MDILEKINQVYNQVQGVEIQATEGNVNAMINVLSGMKEIYAGAALLQKRVVELTKESQEPKEEQDGADD